MTSKAPSTSGAPAVPPTCASSVARPLARVSGATASTAARVKSPFTARSKARPSANGTRPSTARTPPARSRGRPASRLSSAASARAASPGRSIPRVVRRRPATLASSAVPSTRKGSVVHSTRRRRPLAASPSPAKRNRPGSRSARSRATVPSTSIVASGSRPAVSASRRACAGRRATSISRCTGQSPRISPVPFRKAASADRPSSSSRRPSVRASKASAGSGARSKVASPSVACASPEGVSVVPPSETSARQRAAEAAQRLGQERQPRPVEAGGGGLRLERARRRVEPARALDPAAGHLGGEALHRDAAALARRRQRDRDRLAGLPGAVVEHDPRVEVGPRARRLARALDAQRPRDRPAALDPGEGERRREVERLDLAAQVPLAGVREDRHRTGERHLAGARADDERREREPARRVAGLGLDGVRVAAGDEVLAAQGGARLRARRRARQVALGEERPRVRLGQARLLSEVGEQGVDRREGERRPPRAAHRAVARRAPRPP